MNPRLPDKPEEYLTTRGLADYIADRRLSQSFMARLNVCPQSAHLYAKHRGTRVQSHAMARGEAAHEAFEWHTQTCISEGVEQIDPDVLREQIDHICESRPELVIPAHERDVLRGMAWNYAEATRVNLENPPKTEIDIAFPLGNWTLIGRIDWLTIVDRHDAYLKDYKTALSMPSVEEFEKGFQGYFYALAVVEQDPKIERVHFAEEYPRLLSKRCMSCGVYNLGHVDECKECAGLNFDPPTLGRRRMTLEKRDLHDFKRTLESNLAHMERYLKFDSWPASPGSHCSTCPARRECPLPTTHLPLEIADQDEAVEVAQNLHVLDDIRNDVRGALKAFVDDTGTAIRYGDLEWDFRPEIKNAVDKKRMQQDADAGRDINPRDYIKESVSWRFDCRTRDQTHEPAPSQRFHKEAA